jgi:hypothetical protein
MPAEAAGRPLRRRRPSMSMPFVALVALLVGAVPGTAPGAPDASSAAPRIDHAALTCVVAGRYPRIEAQVTPPDVSEVRARFRLLDSEGWYSVRLSRDGDQWSGSLPRPTARLDSFIYRLEATDEAARTGRTSDTIVRVVSDDGDCGAEGAGPSVADASPVVEAPPGAPDLPEGFGGGGQEEPTVTGAGKGGVFNLGPTVSLLAGLGVTAAAVAVGMKSGDSPATSAFSVAFVGSDPGEGSEISLRAFNLALRFHVVPDVDIPSGSVDVSLRPAFSRLSCLDMSAPFSGLSASRGAVVTVERVVLVSCQAPFSLDEVQVRVRGPQQGNLFAASFRVSFRVTP